MSKQTWFIGLIAFIAAIAGFLFGFDTGIISGALKYISQSFGIAANDSVTQELIVSAVPMGALVGAIFSGKSSQIIGRHDSILISAVLFTMGTFAIVFASSVETVIIGRFILGLSVGLSAMVVPMYLSEVSPANIRGSLIFVFQLAITIGILFSYLVNYFYSSTANWRAMFAIGLAPSVLLGIGMLFLPKSPRWLLLNGQEEEAKKSLQRIRPEQDITEEFSQIKATCDGHKAGTFKDLFSRQVFPLVLIAFGLFAVQQLSGINTIFYYAPRLFQEAGITNDQNAILAAVICGATNVGATFFGIYLVEHWGRRKLLFGGLIGLIVSLTALGFGYHGLFGDNFGLVSILLILSIIFFFATSLSGIPYIIMAEIFPLHVRHLSMALASCANWGFNMLVSATFLSAIDFFTIGNTYLIYATCTAVGLVMLYKFLPETKDQTLESLEKTLSEDKAESGVSFFEEEELKQA